VDGHGRDNFLVTPHADEVLVLADGRHLAWAEWGDPRGSPLVLFHPWPGSRLLCPDPAATTAAGIRLITVDRPGYGRSDPVADPTLAGFADDLDRLLDHLWLGQVPVVGWSAGGQYAAACGAVMADRVSAVALVATPAPDEHLDWLTPPFREVAELANQDPRRALEAANRLGAAPGQASDVVAWSRPWGFAPSQVRARATLFYDADDPVIGRAHGRWWANALPRAELKMGPRRGTSESFVAWSEILRSLADPPGGS
jgi:pimeloyl-ACP methyl ester carboxylesterase